MNENGYKLTLEELKGRDIDSEVTDFSLGEALK